MGLGLVLFYLNALHKQSYRERENVLEHKLCFKEELILSVAIFH